MKMRENYLICLDLDGTLLTDDKKITEYTAKVIKSLPKNYRVCLFTGRMPALAIDYYHQLGLDTLMCNIEGCLVSNPAKNETLLKSVFNKDVVQRLMHEKAFKQLTAGFGVLNADFSCFNIGCLDEKLQDELGVYWGQKVETKDEKALDDVDDLFGMIIFLKQDADVQAFCRLVSTVSKNTLNATYWPGRNGLWCVSVTSIFATKKTALRYACAYYNIPFQNVYVYGDASNDLPIFKKVAAFDGHTVAMKNAIPELKAVAKHVTEFDNNNDGVAKSLQQLILKNDKIKLS